MWKAWKFQLHLFGRRVLFVFSILVGNACHWHFIPIKFPFGLEIIAVQYCRNDCIEAFAISRLAANARFPYSWKNPNAEYFYLFFHLSKPSEGRHSAYSFRLNRCHTVAHTTTSQLMCTMFQISFQLRLRTAITLSLHPLVPRSLALFLLCAPILRVFFFLLLLFFCTQWRMWWQFAPASHRFISARSFLSLFIFSNFPTPSAASHTIHICQGVRHIPFNRSPFGARVLCRFSF